MLCLYILTTHVFYGVSSAVVQALAMSTDVVLKPNPDALTLEDFNITNPYKMEECAISVVRRFRTVQHFGFVKGYH